MYSYKDGRKEIEKQTQTCTSTILLEEGRIDLFGMV